MRPRSVVNRWKNLLTPYIYIYIYIYIYLSIYLSAALIEAAAVWQGAVITRVYCSRV